MGSGAVTQSFMPSFYLPGRRNWKRRGIASPCTTDLEHQSQKPGEYDNESQRVSKQQSDSHPSESEATAGWGVVGHAAILTGGAGDGQQRSGSKMRSAAPAIHGGHGISVPVSLARLCTVGCGSPQYKHFGIWQ